MSKNDTPPSFAELIEDAQRTPTSDSLGVDISSPFPSVLPAEHVVRNMDEEDPAKIPGVPKYKYDAHVKFYELPGDIDQYQETLNEILNGHAILRFEERHFTKEGDCLVVVNYLTYTPPREPDADEEERRRHGN
jgi:hypothetical protein